jgi:hypothetical protein
MNEMKRWQYIPVDVLIGFPIILHEVGHFLMACLVGVHPSRIKFSYKEIEIYGEISRSQDLAIAAAGVLTNFTLGAILAFYSYQTGSDVAVFFSGCQFALGAILSTPMTFIDGSKTDGQLFLDACRR